MRSKRVDSMVTVGDTGTEIVWWKFHGMGFHRSVTQNTQPVEKIKNKKAKKSSGSGETLL